MNVIEINPNELKAYTKNPRHNEKAIDTVKKSIAKHGFNQPIVVDQNHRICVGHTRWIAAKDLKLTTVPIYEKQMTEAEFIAYNLADNKSHEYSSWDDELLSDLMHEIENLDETLLDSTGFSDKEIEALLDTSELDDLLNGDTTISEHQRGTAGEKAHVKMVQLFYNEVTFPQFIEMAEKIQLKAEKDNLTDTVFWALEKVHGEI